MPERRITPVGPGVWWSMDSAALFDALGRSARGLAQTDADARRAEVGPNRVAAADQAGALRLLGRQFASPLVMLLVAASMLTVLAVALVLRTRRACWRSRPGALPAWTTLGVAALAIALPYLPPAAALFLFELMPLTLWVSLIALLVAYVAATESAKRLVWRGTRRQGHRQTPAAPQH